MIFPQSFPFEDVSYYLRLLVYLTLLTAIMNRRYRILYSFLFGSGSLADLLVTYQDDIKNLL